MSDKLNYDRGFDVDFIKRTVWKALDLPDWIGFFIEWKMLIQIHLALVIEFNRPTILCFDCKFIIHLSENENTMKMRYSMLFLMNLIK